MGGKLPPAALAPLLAACRGAARPELVLGPAVGEDAAVLDLRGGWAVVSADPITGAAGEPAGWLAVHVNCNDVAAAGAEPLAVWAVLLLRAGDPAEPILAGMRRAAAELGVAVAGGHTEYVAGLPASIVVGTALGRAEPGRFAAASLLRPGQELVLTKSAGLEGTYLRLPAPQLAGALSVVADARAALAAGCRAMHDVTEGGVLGAAWEMAEAAGCGLLLDAAAVPVAPETAALCARDGLDPLRLLGSGALLCGADDGAALVARLGAAGVPAAVVGRALPPSAGRWLVDPRTGRQPLAAPCGDAFWSPR